MRFALIVTAACAASTGHVDRCVLVERVGSATTASIETPCLVDDADRLAFERAWVASCDAGTCSATCSATAETCEP